MTKTPAHTIEAIEGSTTQHLLRLEILTLDKHTFEQIEQPPMPPLDEARKIAKRQAIAIVIVPGELYNQAWLIGQGEHRFWRWSLGSASALSDHADTDPWLLTLPQIFLTKSRRKKGA